MAFRKISGEIVRVHGAGRTDAGVHALAQCAHVDVLKKLLPKQWTRALNSVLPPTIRILRAMQATSTFHARFSAKGKVYRYRIWSGAVLPPFEHGRAWHVPRDLDPGCMRDAAKILVGKHDFGGFAANRRPAERNRVRTMRLIKISRSGAVVTVEFEADGFLYKMARLITGELVDCGSHKSSPKRVAERLSGGVGGRRIAAPACGLFLVRVRY